MKKDNDSENEQQNHRSSATSEEQTDRIFSDKIKLAAIIITSEMQLIDAYNNLIYNLRVNTSGDPSRFLELKEFWETWQHAAGLYDFLKGEYAHKVSKEKQDMIKDLIFKFQHSKDDLSMDQLYDCKEIILEIMGKAGFHSVVSESKDIDNIEEGLI